MSHMQVGRNHVSIDSTIIFYYYLQMFLHNPLFLLGSQLTSHFSPNMRAKYADLYILLCQTGSKQKSNKPCVLQLIIVKYQILTEETGVNKEKKIQT